ncbi:MAG: flagellar basal body L-ring protein FlgH [Polyangiaceae bacterium]
MRLAVRTLFALLVGSSLLPACGPNHIQPFTARDRKYSPGEYAATRADAKPSAGSLYSEAQPGYLEDTRALRVGDIAMIKINENAQASGDATTNLSKDTSRSASVDNLLGLIPAMKKAYPNIDPSNLIKMASSADFAGAGKTERTGTLTATIGVRVKQEMPNGDLFVEGTKVVMINHEEYHLYVSGVIRPSDIAMDNSIDSSLIADARVEFTGRGDINDQVERGWLNKILDFVNPF